MNGLTKNYKKYNEYLKNMPEPILPSQLPRKKINFSAIVKYAKKNNTKIAELSGEEKELLIKKIGIF